MQLSADDFEDTGVILGQGASGQVKHMIYKSNGENCAVKVRVVYIRKSMQFLRRKKRRHLSLNSTLL